MKKELSPQAKARLKLASDVPIAGYFASLPVADKRSFWLAQGNRYRAKCTQQYDDDLPKKANGGSPGKGLTVNHADMVAYIAASGPTHAIDGWSFLGRSIDACLRNDPYNAIHLAYYAELRAAMALLASVGIGILNSNHTRVNKAGLTSNYAKQNTHSHIWPCLYYWSSCNSAFRLLDSVFQPAGIPLSTWFASLGATRPVKAVARQVFRMWGLDLKILSGDHNLRNQVSYRPSELVLPPVLGVHAALSFVSNLWGCFEPSSAGRFPTLEAGLLGRALRAGKAGVLDATRIQLVGMTPIEAARWATVLAPANEPEILAMAAKLTTFGSSTFHLEIIARAALLLALATTSVRRHLASSGYTSSHLRFWWQRHGELRGLWNNSAVPSNPFDAWSDIKLRLEDVNAWRQSNPTVNTFYDWRRGEEGAKAVELFGAFELVAIWGLMP